MEEEWVRTTKTKIDEIKKLTPKDRLQYAAACAQCASAIYNSIGGWMSWLTNPVLLNDFDEQTLNDFFSFFKKFTTDFLEFDISATQQRKPIKRGIV